MPGIDPLQTVEEGCAKPLHCLSGRRDNSDESCAFRRLNQSVISLVHPSVDRAEVTLRLAIS
jgi:hypothetical protein